MAAPTAELWVRGSVRPPGDKSISHRALLLGALGNGQSRICGLPRAADVESTAGALRGLGVSVAARGDEVVISGAHPPSLSASHDALDCGNSGTTVRLLAGMVAAHAFKTRFTGDASLARRPMERIAKPLRVMGAAVELSHEGGLPMTIHGGPLRPLVWRSEIASAQVKSALLLAGICASVPVQMTEPYSSRDHTERLLLHMGATLSYDDQTVRLQPAERLDPLELTIPGDVSSAANLIALAVLADGGELTVEDVLLNSRRTGFLSALLAMGGSLEVECETVRGGEPVGTVVARPSALKGTTIGAREVPSLVDELPLLACVAVRAEGVTVITGAAELRLKESDRIATVASNLRALGVQVEELKDGLAIQGSTSGLRGTVRTAGDHRIAMAFGVLGKLRGNDILIDDRRCVSISYPAFWSDLERISGA